MNIDIKKISELNEAIYNDNLLFLVEDQDGKGKKFKGVNFKEDIKSDLIAQDDVLSYEEIMATTPPIKDFDKCPPSAGSLKTLRDNFNNQLVEINGLPFYSFEMLGVSYESEVFFKAWCNKLFTDHKNKLYHPILARVSPNSTGIVIGHMYSEGTSPRYAGFLYIGFGGPIFSFGYNDGNWYWRQI